MKSNSHPRATRSPLHSIRNCSEQARELLGREIWELEHLGSRTVRARLYLILRVLTLTWQGLRRNRIPIQAAALTFYSLVGIGPLIALGIMISGFAIEKGSDDIIIEGIYRAIAFAAPQIAIESEEGAALSTQMMEIINQFSEAASSGTFGIFGLATLFVIGIQVLGSIEGSFNSLWGVEKGRKLGERIVTYWTFISLGAVLGTLSLTLLAANAFVRFASNLPFGQWIAALIQVSSPVIAFALLVTLLAIFFRFIPNTQVQWRAAFFGGIIVIIMLHLYNLLAFLGMQRVVQTNSLYGSVGILVVLMLGLYFFWLLILFGGQITYAVQNADFLTNENAWQKTSERAREVISLSILIMVMERFQNEEPPLQSSEILERIRVPSHIMNNSIAHLCEIGFLIPVEGKSVSDERDRAYLPGKPAESITLGRFKQSFETFGNNEGTEIISKTDRRIRSYMDEILSLKGSDAAKTKISDLI